MSAHSLEQAAGGGGLSRPAAQELATAGGAALSELCEAAAELRSRLWGSRLTFSPKVFLPLTNLCRNRCDYCSFRKSAGQKGEWTMSPVEIDDWLTRGEEQGATEALFCLGDTPETEFPSYGELLQSWGHGSTVDFIDGASQRALELGLLPHTNAGVLDKSAMARLRRTNPSLGLMLENISPRLCEPGMPHRRAPDKRPELRVRMIDEAGELRIPFTTGILLGIGETEQEQVDSLFAIAELAERHGHVQEVIVQNFRVRPKIPMREAPEPAEPEVARAVALARLILPGNVSVQAPPNLNPGATEELVRAGINDFGGISPVTPDYINPIHPWPHLEQLAAECAALGFELAPRLPVYPSYLEEKGWVDDGLRSQIEAAEGNLGKKLPSMRQPRLSDHEPALRSRSQGAQL